MSPLSLEPLPPRKRRISREERRERLLQVAITLFGERGFRGTTTQLLAERAGVSEALIFQHFSSKREILLASMDRIAGEMLEGMRAVLKEGGEDPQKILEGLLSRLYRLLEKRPEIARFSLMLLTELEDPEVLEKARGYLLSAVKLIARAITRGQEKGLIDARSDPEVLAFMVVGFYQLLGLIHRFRLSRHFPPERFARLVAPFLKVQVKSEG